MRLTIARCAAIIIATLVSACAATSSRLDGVGKAPPLSPLQDPSLTLMGGQPALFPTARPVVRGEGQGAAIQTNSLWRAGSNTFFGDPRASKAGDVLTVEINISDQASLSNSTSRERDTNESLSIGAFFGIPQLIGKVLLPGGVDETAPVSVTSSSSFEGEGDIDRSETVRLTVAAFVTQVLPNGNLVIAGSQEVRINHEVRALTVTGVVRPQDITAANTIAHTKIGEARIAYGGRGVLSDAQRPGVAAETWGVVNPF